VTIFESRWPISEALEEDGDRRHLPGVADPARSVAQVTSLGPFVCHWRAAPAVVPLRDKITL
jgi:hypothetical protein